MFVCSLEGVLLGEDRRVGVVRCAVCGVSVGGLLGGGVLVSRTLKATARPSGRALGSSSDSVPMHATVVRTLPSVATIIPIQPAEAERAAPTMKPAKVRTPSGRERDERELVGVGLARFVRSIGGFEGEVPCEPSASYWSEKMTRRMIERKATNHAR